MTADGTYDEVTVTQVLATMNQLVARDGGVIELTSYEPGADTIQVQYTVGVNDECDTCSISAKMLQQFLLESLRSHGLNIDEVVVVSAGRPPPHI